MDDSVSSNISGGTFYGSACSRDFNGMTFGERPQRPDDRGNSA
ncbi:hypothetical protein [Streptomyces katrae]|nr:hypothetical protein [Streptomyces katrae]